MSTKLTVPELGAGPRQRITVSCWLVSVGDEVIEGDRVVELLLGDVTFDVSAPVSGRLKRIVVEADDRVQVGSVLGYIEAD
jgi:pyruvate dehydrogenase E2 component (dihydrolipoamide acetyltransferase)